MPKKVSKKTSVVRRSKTVEPKQSPFILMAVVVISAVVIAPALWIYFESLLISFAFPAIVTFAVAFMFEGVTGTKMTTSFKNETTVIVVVLAMLATLYLTVKPSLAGSDASIDTSLSKYLIFSRSLWVLAVSLVTVYLPLGITVPKNS